MYKRQILGLVLYPQDLIFLAALLVLSALALFFFTAVAGRLWCGYTCPQTVYTEKMCIRDRWTTSSDTAVQIPRERRPHVR